MLPLVGRRLEAVLYMASWSGKDRLDLWENNRKMWDKFGKEGEALAARNSTLIRKRRVQELWYLPELSYIAPEGNN